MQTITTITIISSIIIEEVRVELGVGAAAERQKLAKRK